MLAYSIWFGGVGHLGLSAHSDRLTLATFTALPNYVWTGLSGDLGQVFNLEAAGAAILVGLGAWVAWHMRRLWVEHPALLGLCVAALAFYALAAVGRDASQVNPNVSRYVYVAVALLLPVIATVLSSLGAWPAARVTALALLAFTILGNIGQAQTWTSSRTAIATTLKKQLFATGELVAAGVTDVSGPQAAPIETAPNLSVADIKRLERSHLLPDGPLSPLDMVNARTVLAVGVWDGFNMTLSGKPLSGGKFDFVKVMFGTVTAQHKSCATFAPQAISPAMQVWLHIPAGKHQPR